MTTNPMELTLYSQSTSAPGGCSIGAILIDAGRLSVEDADRIHRAQKGQGKRFGDAAIALGLLTEEDIRFALASQFEYSYLAADDNSLSHELAAAYEPSSPVVEQLRVLRSQLMLRWFNAESRSEALAIVSPGQGEGRSFIAANLAIVFSQLGERTLLIDANLRTPRQHEIFKLGNNGGLSEVLAARASEAAVVVKIPALIDLYVLPAGAVPPNPQELLGRPTLAKALRSLSNDFDVVIMDTPAAGNYADAQTIAARAGSALMLARKNHSSFPDVVELSSSLRHSGATLVGSVLNDI